jgi:hypothetical protein
VAELSELDLECLEYQTGYLSGFMISSSWEPEQMTRYATRYAIVLAALGRMKESNFQSLLAEGAAPYIGRKASKAWSERPLVSRLTATQESREQWEAAYTQSLFADADANLQRLAEYTAEFREQMSHHFTKAGSTRRKADRRR